MELDDDLNNFFRSTDIGQIYIDSQLVIRKFTPAAMQQINLIEGDVGRSILQITHNIQHPGFITDILEAIKQTVVIEREVQDTQGNWYLMRILPYITQDRLIDGAIILFININELKSLHSMQASILDSSPYAILALKAIRNNLNIIVDFTCPLLNNKAQEFLAVTENGLINKPLSKAYPFLLHNGLFEHYIQVINNGHALDIEHFQPLSEGSGRWVRLSAAKLNDGLVISLQDITKRKSYEQQLLNQQAEIKASAERFRTLLEAVPHITWTNKPNGENISFNHYWHEYTGFTEEESSGWGWTKPFHPDDLKIILPDYEESLKTGKTHAAQARILRRADQQYRWHLIKDVPIRNEQGEITMWVGTATDIQEQKDAEEANIKLRLQQQKQILKTILETQEGERKNISEALHNGLGQLLYAAKLNLDDLKLEGAKQKEVKQQVNTLITEAIATTRNISFELTPTVLRDFGLQSAIEEFVNRIAGSKLKITCDFEGMDAHLDDLAEISLYRIIQELLNNIIKHSEATEASIELIKEENRVYLRVQDNGKGFKNPIQTKRKGMGLSSIRNRVDLLEGKLKIDSRPNKGTVFEIKFKISPN